MVTQISPLLGFMVRALFSPRYAKNTRDFAKMGRGIEARYARCKEWWDPHLGCTREFISRNLKPSRKVLILGAGRLLDLDLVRVLEQSEEVHLYDADPACRAAWKRYERAGDGAKVRSRIGDCTEVFDTWTAGLQEAARTGDLSGYLRSCRAPVPAWSREGFDGIISLNLLGQIPLYWRDRVLNVKPQLDEDERAALEASMGALQVAHLQGIGASAGAWSIVVTDSEYYFYQSDSSYWRVERALCGGSKELLRSMYAGAAGGESWFWHVSPQFVECDDEGEIHRVEAFARA